MDLVTEKARVLIEALPYIQDFRDAEVVIKIGGSAMEDPAHVAGVLTDVIFMECVGMKPIIVHGGGKAISRRMDEAGIETRFLHGLRVTCERAIQVVEKVIKHEVNPQIVSRLAAGGAKAECLHGEDILKVTKKTLVDENTGDVLDWGFVGEPREVDTGPIRAVLARDTIPVITPLGLGSDNRIHNVNADSTASAVARALKARKLVFLSDVPGLLRDPEDEDSIISTVRVDEVARLVEEGVIAGGMLPKIQGCLEALHDGVRKVHMVDGRQTHSLLLEIFTDKGVGTEIIN